MPAFVPEPRKPTETILTNLLRWLTGVFLGRRRFFLPSSVRASGSVI